MQSRCKSAGLKLTAIQMASAIYATPQKPKPDTRPQLAAGIAVAGCIVFAFVGWIIYLESEKSRSCCGYTWCASPSLCVQCLGTLGQGTLGQGTLGTLGQGTKVT